MMFRWPRLPVIPVLLSAIVGYSVADETPGVPAAGESVLLIYTTADLVLNQATNEFESYDSLLMHCFRAALSAVPAPGTPRIDTLEIPAGHSGIYTDLMAKFGKSQLTDWCQVYDLRFRQDRIQNAWTGQAQEDVFTMLGTNSDYSIFQNYLREGGSLFMLGEHHDFYIRNANLISFVNDVAASPITLSGDGFVKIHMDDAPITEFSTTVQNFATDFNTLTGSTLPGYFVGGIDLNDLGSARPLTTLDIGAMAIAYLPTDLKREYSGKMVVSFESNAFTESTVTTNAWIQNVYDLLSGCYRFDLQKTFVPAEGRLNEEGTFEISYVNTGANDIVSMVVRDSIPGCLGFVSSTPAPTLSSGKIYEWNVGTVKVGASGKVVVRFNSLQRPPCP